MGMPNRNVEKVFTQYNVPAENVDYTIDNVLLTRSAGGAADSGELRPSNLTPGIKSSSCKK